MLRNAKRFIYAAVMANSKKRKKMDLLAEKSLTNCPLLGHKQTNLQRKTLLIFGWKLVFGGDKKKEKTTAKLENRRKFQNFSGLTNSGQDIKESISKRLK